MPWPVGECLQASGIEVDPNRRESCPHFQPQTRVQGQSAKPAGYSRRPRSEFDCTDGCRR